MERGSDLRTPFLGLENPEYACSVPVYVSHYMLGRPTAFPQWKTDVRNVLSLLLARTSVAPDSAGDVYSGAWAFPESTNCCGKSLQYPIVFFAAALARYGVLTDMPGPARSPADRAFCSPTMPVRRVSWKTVLAAESSLPARGLTLPIRGPCGVSWT